MKNFYWNTKEWSLNLSEKAEKNNVRIPLIMVLILAPLLGGLFVFFLPFIGFALILDFVYQKIRGKVHDFFSSRALRSKHSSS